MGTLFVSLTLCHIRHVSFCASAVWYLAVFAPKNPKQAKPAHLMQ